MDTFVVPVALDYLLTQRMLRNTAQSFAQSVSLAAAQYHSQHQAQHISRLVISAHDTTVFDRIVGDIEPLADAAVEWLLEAQHLFAGSLTLLTTSELLIEVRCSLL